jgi:hypothetical protein
LKGIGPIVSFLLALHDISPGCLQDSNYMLILMVSKIPNFWDETMMASWFRRFKTFQIQLFPILEGDTLNRANQNFNHNIIHVLVSTNQQL